MNEAAGDRYAPRGPLGDLEDRIRIALDQEGRIPLELLHGIVVAVRGQDLTLPGMSRRRGRRWMAASQTSAAGSAAVVVPTNVVSSGVILEQVSIAARVATGQVWWRAMAEATVTATWPGLLSTSNVFSCDAKSVTAGAEIALAQGIIAPGGRAMPADLSGRANLANNGPIVVLPVQVFIGPGQGFEVAAVAATTELDVTFFGRVF